MDEFADFEALEPLLDVARTPNSPDLRVAALETASRFKLDATGWHELSSATRSLLGELPPGSPQRGAALNVAAGIPLTSVRRALREMAEDPSDPDAEHVAAALARVRDPSRTGPLLDQVRAGHFDAFEPLAAMPIEDSSIRPADLPPADERFDADQRFWRALALARLGEYSALDDFLSGREDTPRCFWGDPWSAYSVVAGIAPIPDAMRQRLLDSLPAIERIEDAERRRMAELIVWGATGVADATGTLDANVSAAAPDATSAHDTPTVEHHARATAAEAAEARAAAVQTTRQIAEQIRAADVSEITPPPDTLETLGALPPDHANELVLSVIDAADRRAETLAYDDPSRTTLGNGVVEIVSKLGANPAWPVAGLVDRFLGRPQPLLDTAQMAFILARAPLMHVTRNLVHELAAAGARSARAFDLLGAIADIQSGRAASPWRGAGGVRGSGGPPVLIDDEAHEAALPPTSLGDSAEEPDVRATEQRRVHAKVLQGGRPRRSFVAGAEHVLRCWIGLPEEGEAASDRAVPEIEIPQEGLPLTVQLLWNGVQASGSLLLPADRTARSNDCDLGLRVPEGERFVSAEIAFLYRGRVFEIVRVEAFVLQPDEVETDQHTLTVRTQIQRREVVELEDRAEYRSLFIWGNDNDDESTLIATRDGSPSNAAGMLLEFGANGAARYSLTNATRAIQWLNAELFITDKSLVRSRGAVDAPVLDDQHPLVLSLLRQLARHGTELYNQLRGQRLSDPGERIQLLNRSPDEYVPLEFVYDAGYPADDAKLCAGWQAALAGDDVHCPTCKPPSELSEEERDLRDVICPLGFWSLQKIIERLDPLQSGTAGSAPQSARRQLGPLDRIVYAASHNVMEDDRQSMEEGIARCVGRSRAARADDWQTWRTALMDERTPLLLALPHHGIDSFEDYLEVGGEPTVVDRRRLARGRLSNLYVNPNHDEPGPIVVLLGCETGAVTETGYVSLARRFQQLETSIVVGTLAKVLGRHAAPVAQELVSQLTAMDDVDCDFGAIMRRVRRRMLAKGHLLALCLVALGDADWRLSPPAGRTGTGA